MPPAQLQLRLPRTGGGWSIFKLGGEEHNPSSTSVSLGRARPRYFELLSFFSGALPAVFSAPFASGFGHLKKALILSSTVIIHLPYSCEPVIALVYS